MRQLKASFKVFDVSYISVDSIQEGVGASQIIPLVKALASQGKCISLTTFEKLPPPIRLKVELSEAGVHWIALRYGKNGALNGLLRLGKLVLYMPRAKIIHARSDIPAVAAVLRFPFGNILWDVRSLWADQKVMIQKSLTHKALYGAYRGLESVAANRSAGMSTLTSAVVPILEKRHKQLPQFRIVVPTAVDLDYFKFNPVMPSKALALFSGTYNDYYDLDLSSLFMEELRKQIIVETDWARPLESNKSSLGVGEERVFPTAQTGMAELIPNYSFGISICKMNAGPSLTAAMPTKIGEFLACGRPVVVNKGLGDMDQFIEEFDAGVILDGSSDNLIKAASRLIDLTLDPQTPQRCRALAEKYFSMDLGARKYLDLYSQMLSVKK